MKQKGKVDEFPSFNISGDFPNSDKYPSTSHRANVTLYFIIFSSSHWRLHPATPNEDADMSRFNVTATAVLVALTTVLLSACGPDDSNSANMNQSTAATSPVTPAATSSGQDNTAAATTPAFGASAALAGTAAPGTTAASDSAVQSVQASLAGDSQQVTPVLRYAPGDSDQNDHSN